MDFVILSRNAVVAITQVATAKVTPTLGTVEATTQNGDKTRKSVDKGVCVFFCRQRVEALYRPCMSFHVVLSTKNFTLMQV
jgi:hypothetical protein